MESLESRNQNLSFNALTALSARKGIPALRNPGALRTSDGRYSNLALLLSDQCPWDTVIVSDRGAHRIGGSVAAQVSSSNWAVTRSRSSLSADSEAGAMHAAALSEVILNAACHRSYFVTDPTVIKILPGSITVVSPGGIVSRHAYGHRTRNPALADALDCLGFKDWSAHGMGAVMHAYRSC